MKLRWYQEEALSSLWQYFCDKPGNPLIAMPTGTGKSLVIAEIVRRVMGYPGQRIMMLTHVKELIVQNMDELLALWPTAPAGIYSAGVGRRDYLYPITYAGIGSVSKRANLFGKVDIVIIDEAHLVSHTSTTMYRDFLAKLKKVNPKLRVIGLSATCYRLGLGMLTDGGLFTDICYDLTTMESFNRLVEEGYLAPLIPKRTELQFDTSGVKLVGGEFNQHELQDAVDIDYLTQQAVRETIQLGQARKHWLVFTTGIEHCTHVAEAFNSFGVRAAHVHSDMPKEVRDEQIAGFKSGKYRAMVNSNILTTGFNHPALDLISVMLPTNSTNRWVQILGRGTRPFPRKDNCMVLDFAQNTQRLGPINDPCIPKKKGSKGGGTAPIKLCPSCNTYNHASVRACVNCKYEFPKEVKLMPSASSMEVMRITPVPLITEAKVDRVIYTTHKKLGRPDSLKVTYYCGLRLYSEYVCLEYSGVIRGRAHEWWRRRSPMEPPATVADAMHHINTLLPPSKIRVQTNTKYPEVIDHEF